MSRIQIKNVRLSFPSLFEKSVFEGKEGKYEATFLLPKEDTKTKKILDNAINELLTEAKIKVKEDMICLKDGDEIFEEKEYEGYEGHWALKASNKKRPLVIDRDRTPLDSSDEKPYAGCYVNAIIEFWAQNNAYGKRINANLFAVQFLKDGKKFGNDGPVDVKISEEFEDLGDLDDDI